MAHTLNYCGKLCLPKKFTDAGRWNSLGIRDVVEYDNMLGMPMFASVTPKHLLFGAKPVATNLEEDHARILQPDELDSTEKLDALIKNPNYVIAGPDHVYDNSKYVQPVMEGLDENLRDLVGKVLDQGEHTGVMIWYNNGLGQTVTQNNNKEGVLRDRRGLMNCTRLNGEIHDQYPKGLIDSYQNTGHLHIHFAPVTENQNPGPTLENMLETLHDSKKTETMKAYRELVKTNSEKLIPAIAYCFVTDKKSESVLEFDHYFGPNNCYRYMQDSMSGVARSTIAKFTEGVMGESVMSPMSEPVKAFRQDTAKFYQSL